MESGANTPIEDFLTHELRSEDNIEDVLEKLKIKGIHSVEQLKNLRSTRKSLIDDLIDNYGIKVGTAGAITAALFPSPKRILLNQVRTQFDDVFANVTNFDEVGLEGQSDVLNELQEVVRINLENWNDPAATSHFILFIGGACGIGKTRLGKELYLHCSKSLALKDSMYVYIKVDNDIISAELSHNVESLLVEMAARYRQKGHSSNPLVIFLHVDDLQHMSKDHFTLLRDNLTGFMAGDSVSAKMQHQIKVIPILTGVPAGLMVSQLMSSLRNVVSNSRVYLVTPNTLSSPADKSILRNVLRAYVKRGELEESQIELFMQNEGVMYTLASVGGLPRPIEILAAVLVHADESIWSNREALFDAVQVEISKTYGAASWVERLDRPIVHGSASKDAHDAMKRLMSLTLTSQWVPLNTKLNEKGLTIEQAEEAGFCVLKWKTKDGVRISVKPTFSEMFLSLINKQHS